TGTFFGFLMAHTVLALPFVVIPVTAALRGFDTRYEQAAAVMGAGRLTAFRTVTLPMIAPGVAAGALFAFVTSFDEVVVSLFVQSPYLRTLPVQMYSSVTRDTDPTIAAAATLIICTTTALVTAAALLMSRRSHAGCTRHRPGPHRHRRPVRARRLHRAALGHQALRRLHRRRRRLPGGPPGGVHHPARPLRVRKDH